MNKSLSLAERRMRIIKVEKRRRAASFSLTFKDDDMTVRAGWGFNWLGMVERAVGYKYADLELAAGREVIVKFNCNGTADRLMKVQA